MASIKEDRPVLSRRTREDLESGQVTEQTSLNLSDAPTSPLPRNVKPMLAHLVEEPFDGPEWLYEIKWDGYRAIAEVVDQGVRLYSRNLMSLNVAFAPIVDSLKRLGRTAVLDGEVVVVDDDGKPNFQLLQNFERSRRGNLIYYVFDLLYLDGHDLRRLPLIRRKEILRQILPDDPRVRFSDYVEETGVAFFRAVVREGIEGVVAKKKESIYQEGERTGHWLKIKKPLRQEAVIGGFTEPRGGRQHLGALLLGVYQGPDLIYVGHVGSGFGEKMLADLRKRLNPLVQKSSPFADPPRANAPVRWVRPEIVCEVRFSEWTAGGIMRQPVFVGLRPDKTADQVRREVPAPVEEAMAVEKNDPNTRLRVGPQMLTVTNLRKVLWPEDGYTKQDLLEYYRNIAPIILPYLRDRPENLLRHPDGIRGESFYQKDVDDQPPKWVQRVRIRSESEEREIAYLVCQDEATLVYMANLGCIEIHPWHSRIGPLEYPDYIVLDLDPLEIGFDAVVEAALVIREILEKAEAPSYCKTSGATGLHIYIPAGAQHDYDTARAFAQVVAQLAHERLPATTSVERIPDRRRGKVYLDCFQNRFGQTLAAPYSLRARQGAPVSTPLKWEKVRPGLDPSSHTMKNIFARIEKIGDIFTPVLGEGLDMRRCLENLQRSTGR